MPCMANGSETHSADWSWACSATKVLGRSKGTRAMTPSALTESPLALIAVPSRTLVAAPVHAAINARLRLLVSFAVWQCTAV